MHFEKAVPGYLVPGYLKVLDAVRLCVSITHPGETWTPRLYDELAGRLHQELWAGRLRAHLLVVPAWLNPSLSAKAPGLDDGKLFEIEVRYWRTPNASNANFEKWVEVPVLEPLPPSAHRSVNKGGYVLIEEEALRALIAGEGADPQPEQTKSIRQEKEAERDLRDRLKAFHDQNGDLPVKVRWVPGVVKRTGVSRRGAERAWAKVGADHPELASSKGKRKVRRPGLS